MVTEKDLRQHDNMTRNYQLDVQETVQNNQPAAGSIDQTLEGVFHVCERRFLFTFVLTAFRLENSGTHPVTNV